MQKNGKKSIPIDFKQFACYLNPYFKKQNIEIDFISCIFVSNEFDY